MTVTDTNIRCPSCGKLIIEQATRPWQATCPRCGSSIRSQVEKCSDNGGRPTVIFTTTVNPKNMLTK